MVCLFCVGLFLLTHKLYSISDGGNYSFRLFLHIFSSGLFKETLQVSENCLAMYTERYTEIKYPAGNIRPVFFLIMWRQKNKVWKSVSG